jgi:hypothetical protein
MDGGLALSRVPPLNGPAAAAAVRSVVAAAASRAAAAASAAISALGDDASPGRWDGSSSNSININKGMVADASAAPNTASDTHWASLTRCAMNMHGTRSMQKLVEVRTPRILVNLYFS